MFLELQLKKRTLFAMLRAKILAALPVVTDRIPSPFVPGRTVVVDHIDVGEIDTMSLDVTQPQWLRGEPLPATMILPPPPATARVRVATPSIVIWVHALVHLVDIEDLATASSLPVPKISLSRVDLAVAFTLSTDWVTSGGKLVPALVLQVVSVDSPVLVSQPALKQQLLGKLTSIPQTVPIDLSALTSQLSPKYAPLAYAPSNIGLTATADGKVVAVRIELGTPEPRNVEIWESFLSGTIQSTLGESFCPSSSARSSRRFPGRPVCIR
jgi:hypothetical protein